MAIELGRFVNGDRAVLLSDDVQLILLSATNSPTFSPISNNEQPTRNPTFRTDAPTTTNILSCPPLGSDPLSVSAGSIMLQGVAETITLCTLTKSVTSSETGITTLVPIARSYNNNPWEKAAGEFAASLFGEKELVCYPSGCQVQLPPLETGAEYLLSSYSHALSDIDEYARFLETATFGTTPKQIDAFETSSSNSLQHTITTWLADQMNSSITPMTSHREYWRRGLNGRVRHSIDFT